MNRLDRYIGVSVLMPLLYCCVAFFFLWLIYDLFDTMRDLLKYRPDFSLVMQFYAYQLPSAAQIILPVSFLFSSLFSLSYLSQNRELVAMQALGVSVLRISLPFLIFAILIAIIQYVFFLDLTPTANTRRMALEQVIKGESTDGRTYSPVEYRDLNNGNMWFLSELDLTNGTFKHGEIIVLNTYGRDDHLLIAAQGTWRDGFWDLAKVRRVNFRIDGSADKPIDLPQYDAKELTIPPEELVATHRPAHEIPWKELQDLRQGLVPGVRSSDLAPYHTEHYYRLSHPLLSVVLWFFAIASGVGHSRRNIAASVFNCVFILFATLIWSNLSLALGRGGKLSPFFAGWNTVMIFGSIGLVLFAHKVGWLWDISHSLFPRRYQ